jgi:hypothetical protein
LVNELISLRSGVRDRGDRVAERVHPRVGLLEREPDGEKALRGCVDVLELERRAGGEVVEVAEFAACRLRGPKEPA